MGSLRSNKKTKTLVKTIPTCMGGFIITEYAREGVFRVDAPDYLGEYVDLQDEYYSLKSAEEGIWQLVSTQSDSFGQYMTEDEEPQCWWGFHNGTLGMVREDWLDKRLNEFSFLEMEAIHNALTKTYPPDFSLCRLEEHYIFTYNPALDTDEVKKRVVKILADLGWDK
jgi:hypothetical protein